MNDDKYIPGVCNIGPAEISNRKVLGWAGLTFTVLLWILFSYSNVSTGIYFILFFPAFASSIGFIQAYNRFCVNYGWRGFFNFSDEIRNTQSIKQKEFIKQDKIKSIKLISYSFIIGFVIALTAFFLN